MAEKGFKRKLTAILSADVEGYSRMMRDDEDATIRTLTNYRTAMSNLIQKFRGHVVDATGDNLLAEFTSVVDAVNCAVEIQRELAERNAELPEERKMDFRIGVNLGDVVQEEGRIYGDGVNIAARMEGLAVAGGICISGSVYDSVESRLGLEYESLGEKEVKNIDKPVRAYRVLSFPGAAAHRVVQAKEALGRRWRNFAIAAGAVVVVVAVVIAGWQYYKRQPEPLELASLEKMKLPLPDKPSIAVLAFVNMSGDPNQEYIADGISESIITALSKIPDLFVIARETSFYFKGKAVKIQQVSEELGVRYMLEGSVQRSGDRIRVTAQLIDAVKGHHLWADSYDRNLKDLFKMQDELTLHILKSLQVKLISADRDFAKGTNNLDAYLKFMEGKFHYFRYTKEDNFIGRKLFEKAVAFDPRYLQAYLFLGFSYTAEAEIGWTETPQNSLDKAEQLSKKIISFDDNCSEGYALVAFVHKQRGQFERALSESAKAMAIDPNNAFYLATHASILNAGGRPEEAIIYFEKALRLNQYPGGGIWLLKLAQAYHRTGRYEKALEIWNRLFNYVQQGKFSPKWVYSGITLTYLEMGRDEEARIHATEMLKIEPNYQFISTAIAHFSYKDMAYLKHLLSPLNSLLYTEVGKKKKFTYAGRPEFHFEYPVGSKKIETTSSSRIVRMKTPDGVIIEAGISEIPKGITLADVGQKLWAPNLESYGSNLEIIANNKITLQDNTKAYKTEIKWLFSNGVTWIRSKYVSAFRDNKIVYLTIHPTEGHPAELDWIIESLVFDNK